jgi:uncharacterized integral membrane protein
LAEQTLVHGEEQTVSNRGIPEEDAPATTNEVPPTTEASHPSGAGSDRSHVALRRSKTSALWLGVVALGIFLVLLVILILQNTQRVKVSFLWWEVTPPLAAALLTAAAGGIIVTSTAGTLRILQLRRRVKRN